MAESRDKINDILKKYMAIIAANNIKIDKAYLFGSYAKECATDESDIDVAIISTDFSGDRFADRRKVVPLRRKIDRRLEPMPYRPENFKENDPLVAEILRNGIEIL
jgi:predicted nucleotidyltransferase